MLRLQGYEFKVVYRPGKTNIADTLSRLNSVKPLECGDEYDFVRAVVESCVPVALSPEEIEEASYNDEELCLVKNCVKSGNWQKCTISFICTCQGRTVHLWRIFTSRDKDSGAQGLAGQSGEVGT